MQRLFHTQTAWNAFVLPVAACQPLQFEDMKALAVRAKNAHWKMRAIHRRHWLTIGARHGVVTEDGRDAQAVIDDWLARTPAAVAAVRRQLPQDFPDHVADSILGGLLEAADRLGG